MTASHCVLVSNRSELKSCTDTALTSFYTTKHECRRNILLHGLGSEEERATPAQRCCDIGVQYHFLIFAKLKGTQNLRQLGQYHKRSPKM